MSKTSYPMLSEADLSKLDGLPDHLRKGVDGGEPYASIVEMLVANLREARTRLAAAEAAGADALGKLLMQADRLRESEARVKRLRAAGEALLLGLRVFAPFCLQCEMADVSPGVVASWRAPSGAPHACDKHKRDGFVALAPDPAALETAWRSAAAPAGAGAGKEELLSDPLLKKVEYGSGHVLVWVMRQHDGRWCAFDLSKGSMTPIGELTHDREKAMQAGRDFVAARSGQ